MAPKERNAPAKPQRAPRATNLWTFPVRVVFALIVLLTPLCSVWLATTLAIYLNGPLWMAITAGVLLFPTLPLLWEWRSGLGKETRWFRTADRLILRTLFVNLCFLGAMLYAFPQKSFEALATRGDWPLANHHSAEAQVARATMLKGAQGLEWLYALAVDNPYEKYAGDDGTTHVPTPAPNPAPTITQKPAPAPVPTPSPSESPPSNAPPALEAWPLPESVHPLIATLPPSLQTNYTSVARHILDHFPDDPRQRIKAIHDYIATHIAYDADALFRGDYPPQDAQTVFDTKKAVCAGYAKLFIAMAKVTGDTALYVTGVSREIDGSVANGPGHAWNAVEIEGQWYLMDITWNAGYLEGNRFIKRYSTAYLLTPPQIFVNDHFPEDPAWQLLPTPRTHAEFLRSPMLRPGFYQAGLSLVSPTRSQTSVGTQAQVVLKNPKNLFVTAKITPQNSATSTRCTTPDTTASLITLTCPLAQNSPHEISIFAGPKRTDIPFVGSLEVVGQ